VPFQILDRPLPGVVVLRPDAYADERGQFVEAFRADRFAELGLPSSFVQENQSHSRKGVIRGLHFQWEPPQGKLMRVIRGRAFMVGVDIRHDSETLGRWFGLEGSEEDRIQVWAPAGFARGFAALEDGTVVQYKCTGTYDAKNESGIRWNDPRIGLRWPLTDPILSPKDRDAQSLDDWLRRPESKRFSIC
jgi:dTDP-4-dehydrorhamnose 3,5-epimerase